MGRLLKILAYAVTLFLLYLVVTGFLKSCDSKKNTTGTTTEETYDGDYFEDGDNDTSEEIYGDETGDDNIDYDVIDEALENNDDEETISEPEEVEEEVDFTTPPPAITTTSRQGSSTGSYQVISGSYLVKGNAENMVVKLKKMGYNNSEIVIFDLSQYHTVIASRSNDYDEALSIASDLKNRGVDSYVRRKQ